MAGSADNAGMGVTARRVILADDDHRRVLAVVTYREARWTPRHRG
jgi:anti-sigma factor ChrR (cupin superfamily)